MTAALSRRPNDRSALGCHRRGPPRSSRRGPARRGSGSSCLATAGAAGCRRRGATFLLLPPPADRHAGGRRRANRRAVGGQGDAGCITGSGRSSGRGGQTTCNRRTGPSRSPAARAERSLGGRGGCCAVVGASERWGAAATPGLLCPRTINQRGGGGRQHPGINGRRHRRAAVADAPSPCRVAAVRSRGGCGSGDAGSGMRPRDSLPQDLQQRLILAQRVGKCRVVLGGGGAAAVTGTTGGGVAAAAGVSSRSDGCLAHVDAVQRADAAREVSSCEGRCHVMPQTSSSAAAAPAIRRAEGGSGAQKVERGAHDGRRVAVGLGKRQARACAKTGPPSPALSTPAARRRGRSGPRGLQRGRVPAPQSPPQRRLQACREPGLERGRGGNMSLPTPHW